MFLLAAGDPLDHVTDVILKQTEDGTPLLTMHMVQLVITALLVILVMRRAACAIATGNASEGTDRHLTKGRLGQIVEVTTVYLRDEMIEPILGADTTRRYFPYLLTLFYFILFNNLMGLVPLLDTQHLLGADTTWFGGTATGNIAVTGALAFVAFLVIQAHGFRELGVKGWLEHLCGGLLEGPVGLWLVIPLVFTVELAGLFIKPAALAIRLFANMVAGHTLMAVLVAFGYGAVTGGMGLLGISGITLVSSLGAIAISFLELFVACLQAFIFMFLTAVFISLMSHHDEHAEDATHEARPAVA